MAGERQETVTGEDPAATRLMIRSMMKLARNREPSSSQGVLAPKVEVERTSREEEGRKGLLRLAESAEDVYR
jgi:hypothetical protein